MVWMMWLGATLVILGVLYSAGTAIYRGRMSNPHRSRAGARTLEPKHSGIRAIGLADKWPGLALIVIGAAILLFGLFGLRAL
ncbi:hypothetical protein [Chelativorans salis]|uniref:Uncharacterized protein n=1 Tax=Chelativorans salis TaxID=2978478 RepID=A0ABT2LYZ7_9HYPH|nr:hypothetical protein [Chelativorans sp. EGI FJ00035]MCT7378424.1 hypothetical protein [Chelativorans sp. EGI FJ00035]